MFPPLLALLLVTLFLLRFPPGTLPLSFLALEKRLYRREQDMSQGVRLMDGYPGAAADDLFLAIEPPPV